MLQHMVNFGKNPAVQCSVRTNRVKCADHAAQVCILTDVCPCFDQSLKMC
jgi:hypothetical protein